MTKTVGILVLLFFVGGPVFGGPPTLEEIAALWTEGVSVERVREVLGELGKGEVSEKRPYLNSLIPGLAHDDEEIVLLVQQAIREHSEKLPLRLYQLARIAEIARQPESHASNLGFLLTSKWIRDKKLGFIRGLDLSALPIEKLSHVMEYFETRNFVDPRRQAILFELLSPFLEHSDDSIRNGALLALGKIPHRQIPSLGLKRKIRKGLLELVDAPGTRPSLRKAAAEQLEFQPLESATELVRVLELFDQPYCNTECKNALRGALLETSYIPILTFPEDQREALWQQLQKFKGADKYSVVRLAALIGLRHLDPGDKSVVSGLTRFATGDSPATIDVKEMAEHALLRTEPSFKSREDWSSLEAQPSNVIREKVASLAKTTQDPSDAFSTLLTLLSHPDPNVVNAALETLKASPLVTRPGDFTLSATEEKQLKSIANYNGPALYLLFRLNLVEVKNLIVNRALKIPSLKPFALKGLRDAIETLPFGETLERKKRWLSYFGEERQAGRGSDYEAMVENRAPGYQALQAIKILVDEAHRNNYLREVLPLLTDTPYGAIVEREIVQLAAQNTVNYSNLMPELEKLWITRASALTMLLSDGDDLDEALRKRILSRLEYQGRLGSGVGSLSSPRNVLRESDAPDWQKKAAYLLLERFDRPLLESETMLDLLEAEARALADQKRLAPHEIESHPSTRFLKWYALKKARLTPEEVLHFIDGQPTRPPKERNVLSRAVIEIGVGSRESCRLILSGLSWPTKRLWGQLGIVGAAAGGMWGLRNSETTREPIEKFISGWLADSQRDIKGRVSVEKLKHNGSVWTLIDQWLLDDLKSMSVSERKSYFKQQHRHFRALNAYNRGAVAKLWPFFEGPLSNKDPLDDLDRFIKYDTPLTDFTPYRAVKAELLKWQLKQLDKVNQLRRATGKREIKTLLEFYELSEETELWKHGSR